MAVPTWRVAFGLAKETTWGTPVASTTFLPVAKPSGFVPQYEDIEDDGYRSNASRVQAYYQGVGMTPFDTGDMLVWPDDTVNFLFAMLGADAVTGAGPYTHTITLLNSALPPSYTLTKFDAVIATARRISGAHINEVVLKWTTKGKLLVSVKGWGKIADTVAAPTPSFSALPAFKGWEYTASVGGANTKIEAGEISFKRPLEWIYGGNAAQDATDRVVDVLDVSGRFEFAPTDDTEKAFYTGNTQPAASVTFASGANSILVQMSKVAFKKGSDFDHSAKYAKLKLPFVAVANSTDAGTGNAPVKVVAVSTKSTSY